MLGRLKMIENEQAKFGADPWYLFAKVQDHLSKTEEYWLVTEEEEILFCKRGSWLAPVAALGIFRVSVNNDVIVTISSQESGPRVWRLTAHDLTRIRERVVKNHEDIEANRESWLADLLD